MIYGMGGADENDILDGIQEVNRSCGIYHTRGQPVKSPLFQLFYLLISGTSVRPSRKSTEQSRSSAMRAMLSDFGMDVLRLDIVLYPNPASSNNFFTDTPFDFC